MRTGNVNSDCASRAESVGDGRGKTHVLHGHEFDAVLMDLDGVITETAEVHARAWKRAFDEYLWERAARLGGTYKPFDLPHDYQRYVDGKPRYDGVASFLQSRDMYLPPGKASDDPYKETVCGLGNRKNRYFLEAVRQQGVRVYQGSVDLIRVLRRRGLKVAVVTSSRNCSEILNAAGMADLFDEQVDGITAHEWSLKGKPAPDTFLEAARRLHVDPRRAIVIEDAIAGVRAGKAGRFGLVIGVDRFGDDQALRRNGADIVVSDLGEIDVSDGFHGAKERTPSALERLAEISARLQGRRAAVFLDYDGTLTPIVERPDMAILPDDMRATLRSLAACCTVVVISGRARTDVQALVGVDPIIYAGSHGFDIAGPEGTHVRHEEGATYVPMIAQAARELRVRLASIAGVIVEDKTYAVAVHYRMVRAEDDIDRVEQTVDNVLADHRLLRKTVGKKVFELRPDMNWDKGRAVLWLLRALGLDRPDVVPFYLGDDVTDQDAFEALSGKGIGILVAGTPQPTSADYRLAGPGEVGKFLLWLISKLRERDG